MNKRLNFCWFERLYNIFRSHVIKTNVYIYNVMSSVYFQSLCCLNNESINEDIRLKGNERKITLVHFRIRGLEMSVIERLSSSASKSLLQRLPPPTAFTLLTFSDLIASAAPLTEEDPDYWDSFKMKAEAPQRQSNAYTAK